MDINEKCSLRLLTACGDIDGAISVLKYTQNHLDLKDFVKIDETIRKLEEHRSFIWKLHKEIKGLG